jgi:hypothetical protein
MALMAPPYQLTHPPVAATPPAPRTLPNTTAFDDYYNTDPSAPPPALPWSPDELNQARDYYMNFISQNRIPTTWGDVRDPLNIYQQFRQAGQSHSDALNGSLSYLGWNSAANAPGAGAAQQGGAGGGGSSYYGGGGGTPNGQGLFDPRLYAPFVGTAPTYHAPTLPNAPNFDDYYNAAAVPATPVYRGPGMSKK